MVSINHPWLTIFFIATAASSPLLGSSRAVADPVAFDARSARSGAWSDTATWADARPPKSGDRVQVQPGHVVTYDVASDVPLRMVHVGGTLTFSRDKSTRLDVALLKVQP